MLRIHQDETAHAMKTPTQKPLKWSKTPFADENRTGLTVKNATLATNPLVTPAPRRIPLGGKDTNARKPISSQTGSGPRLGASTLRKSLSAKKRLRFKDEDIQSYDALSNSLDDVPEPEYMPPRAQEPAFVPFGYSPLEEIHFECMRKIYYLSSQFGPDAFARILQDTENKPAWEPIPMNAEEEAELRLRREAQVAKPRLEPKNPTSHRPGYAAPTAATKARNKATVPIPSSLNKSPRLSGKIDTLSTRPPLSRAEIPSKVNTVRSQSTIPPKTTRPLSTMTRPATSFARPSSRTPGLSKKLEISGENFTLADIGVGDPAEDLFQLDL